jgi:multiple sugar transport system permease protein
MAETSLELVQGRKKAGTKQSTWSPLRRREAFAAYMFLAPFLFFFIIFIARSMVTSVYFSFLDYNPLQKEHPFLGLHNYQELLGDSLWWESVWHTVIFAFLTVAGSTVLALGCALAVNQPVKGRNFFRALFYAPNLLSVSAVALIWAWLLHTNFGLVNYALHLLGLPPGAVDWLGNPDLVLPALALTTIWWTFGFPMLIFLAGLQNIPDSVYEAAKIDGANSRQVFFSITLPLLRPTFLFVTVTGFVSHFQVFGQPFIMPTTGAGGPGNASYTVIIYLYQTAWRYLRMGYGSAIAVGLAVIMILFTLVQFRLLGKRAED